MKQDITMISTVEYYIIRIVVSLSIYKLIKIKNKEVF